jgi:hypothetical protein
MAENVKSWGRTAPGARRGVRCGAIFRQGYMRYIPRPFYDDDLAATRHMNLPYRVAARAGGRI